ncbi:hypothetical protein SDC9_87318 [bioreactor metagenome]|uniref:Uncharacterized protein n=1 Tax=bioreactor metagenome TaxID=1076179 RepID=A0A644ZIF2_9ZZZZ
MDVLLLVAGDEVSRVYEVRRLDGLLSEAEVGNRDAAGLLRVIGEIALGVQVSLVADDFDGVLVGAHRSVGAEAPELAADGPFRCGGDLLGGRKRGKGHVVGDADGEMVPGLVGLEVIEYGLDMGRGRVLGSEAVPSADDKRLDSLVFEERADILVQGISESADFLAPVEDRNALHGGRKGIEEEFLREGPVQVHFNDSRLFSPGVQVVDCLLDRLADGTHGHYDVLGVRCTVVVEGMVLAARELFDLLHVGLDDLGDIGVEAVDGFLRLEEDIRVLGGPLLVGMLRVQRAGLEPGDGIIIDNLREVVIFEDVDLLDLVGGAESVKEVQEGDAGLDR